MRSQGIRSSHIPPVLTLDFFRVLGAAIPHLSNFSYSQTSRNEAKVSARQQQRSIYQPVRRPP